jgi:hypothetical protein
MIRQTLKLPFLFKYWVSIVTYRWCLLILSPAVVLHCAVVIMRSGQGDRLFQKCRFIKPNARQTFLRSPVHDFLALACFYVPAFMQFLYIEYE